LKLSVISDSKGGFSSTFMVSLMIKGSLYEVLKHFKEYNSCGLLLKIIDNDYMI
jgi:hypothetical protein